MQKSLHRPRRATMINGHVKLLIKLVTDVRRQCYRPRIDPTAVHRPRGASSGMKKMSRRVAAFTRPCTFDKIASRLLSHDFKGERWLSAWASGATLLAGPQCDIRGFEYRGIAGGIGMRPSGKIAGRGAILRVTFNTRRGGGARGGFHVGRFGQFYRCDA